MEDFQNRLLKLEKSNRFLKTLSAISLLLAIGLPTFLYFVQLKTHRGYSESFRTKNLIVKNGPGEQGILLSSEGNLSKIIVRGPNENEVSIGVMEDMGGLFISNPKNEEPSIFLAAGNKLGSEIILRDNNDKIRMAFKLGDQDGAPRMSVFDDKGKVRAKLGSTDLVNMLGTNPQTTGEGTLIFFDGKGNVVKRLQ